MADRTETIISSANADMLCADYEVWSDFHEMTMGIDITERVFRRGKDFWGRAQNLAGHGSFNLAANLWNTPELADFLRLWREKAADSTATYLPFLWAHNRMKVAERVGFTEIQAKGESFGAPNADVVSGDLSGSWNKGYGEGVLTCASADDGTELLETTANADFAALWRIQGRNADHYSPTTAIVNDGGASIGAICRAKEIVGSDATPASVTFDLPLAWQGGNVPNTWPADGVLRVTHKGVTRSTRLVGAGDTTEFLFNQIGDFQWADGFHIDLDYPSSTQVRFVGSAYGAGEDMIFEASNPAPFRGNFDGTNGGMKLRLVRATGAGGSRTYDPISDFVAADDHHLPLNFGAVDTSGPTQIGIHARLPTLLPTDTPYDFQIRYLLGLIKNGS